MKAGERQLQAVDLLLELQLQEPLYSNLNVDVNSFF